jgi:tetratricopeptide (TPR) repeat protein
MLARDPAERPKDGAEALELLKAFQKTLEPRRQAWLAWSVAAVALVAGGAFALRQRPLPPGRLLTAMADTENLTGDADLDGVGELLRVGLEQSRRVSIMGRSRLVNLLRETGSPIPKVMGEAETRRAAQRANAQVVLVPSVRPAGGSYDVAVHAIDLARNEPLFSIRESMAAKASVYSAIDRVTARIRKALNEDPKEAPKTLVRAVEVSPANPEAMRLYAEGKRLESEDRIDEALAAWEKAAAADPEFVQPRWEIVYYRNAEQMEERTFDAHVSALRKNLHRLPESDRAYAEFFTMRIGEDLGNRSEYLAALDRAIEARPEDYRPYEVAAFVLSFYRADSEAARPYLDKLVTLAPLPPSDNASLIDFLVTAERLDEALAQARRWAEASPNWLSFFNLSFAHRARGETTQALQAARHANALRSEVVYVDAFADADALEEAEELLARARHRWPDWLALRGRVREALTRYDEIAPRKGSGFVHAPPFLDFQARRGVFLLPRGDPNAVWVEIQKSLRTNGWFLFHAWMLAALGDLERAEGLANTQVHDHFVGYRMFRAIRTWKRGDPEGALRAFATIHVASSHLNRGEILTELGRDREAVDACRRYRRLSGVNPWDSSLDEWNYPRSLYLEATALERLGEKDEARKVAGRLLHLWERADPDLPLLREAKALGKRLGLAAKQRRGEEGRR